MDSGTSCAVTELRLSAFRSHRARTLPLAPLTLVTGPSGSGKSSLLAGYEALARLGAGEALGQVFGGARGAASAYVPQGARADPQGRRGFRIGCTVAGPAGRVRLDLAVQAEPELRIAGERLTGPDGQTLFSTALRDPGRRQVQAEWHTSGAARFTRAPLPDDRLATALLPLRVSGATAAQRGVLAAAEQVVLALCSVFPCDPLPERMRAPVPRTDALLRGCCDNLAAVLARTRAACGSRHAALVKAVRAGCRGPVEGLAALAGERALVRAVLDRGETGRQTPVEWLGDGELRYIALALVLTYGAAALSADAARDALPGAPALTVLADGLDRGLDRRQSDALMVLAARMCARGHVRLLGTVRGEAGVPEGALVDLGA
ncbi:ATP-binding protein [Streptomyces armeniacus]|uniref:ATP-binding protein n=1 Tax=Streptomyces armeniacus TaxID=83291 RepID=A0A345XTK6_9ACTN|nr:ATP-binding protein [Streptomyces armeniacus]AXK34972.1 ATP-binding protein [Streptomyces armeniacus]